MTIYYVRSGATGTGTGASWANAYTTLTAALSGKVAGDTLYVSEDHAESTAGAVTLAFPSGDSSGGQIYIICANHAGSVPPVAADLATTATVSTTGGNSIELRGTAYIYGIKFQSSANILLASFFGGWIKCDSCVINLNNATSGSFVQFGNFNAGNDSSKCIFNNTSVNFGHIGQTINMSLAGFEWTNTPSAVTGTAPTYLITNLATYGTATGGVRVRGVDLSGAGSGTLVNNPYGSGKYEFVDCKLGSSAVVVANSSDRTQAPIDLIRCDSSATNYRNEHYTFEGSQVTETTIVRTGGATDGTTAVSWKIVTLTTPKWEQPFESQPIAIWNDTSGSAKTVTVYGIWGGGSVPNNDDIWIDVEYLGSSLTPMGSFANSTKSNILATNAALSTDTSTWGGSTTKFKMSVTITPQMKGPFNIVVKAAKASSTFYIDPKPDVT